MAAATSKQYQLVKQGGPFALASIPKPTPGPDEVSIRIKAIGFNPVDNKSVSYGVMVERWPAVLGLDNAGVIEAVGSNVPSFKPGDEVFGLGTDRKGAAFQEIAVVSPTSIAKKPASLTFEEAVSLPVCYVTAVCAIYETLGIPLPFLEGGRATGSKPDSVLILGGSSAVGSNAVELLRMALPSATILTTNSPQHNAHVITLGATKAFDQRSASLISDIRSATPGGKGVDMIIDAVGSGAQQADICGVLSTEGPRKYAEVTTGAQFETPPDVDRETLHGPTVFAVQGGSNVMPALVQLINQGKYKIPTKVKCVGTGWDAISKGLEELKAGVSGTKLVVSV